MFRPLDARRVDFGPFGSERERGSSVHPVDVDRECGDFATTVDGHAAFTVSHLGDGAVQCVVLADEVRDEAVLRPFVEIVGGGELLNDSVVEHRDAVRHGERFALIVGHVDDGDSQVLMDVLDLVLHLLPELLVEGAQGLVHQHQGGLEDQRPGHRDPLLLAARELGRAPPAETGKLDHLQRLRDPLARLVARHATHFQREEEVLLDRHVGEQRVVLEHHADTALVRRHPVDGPGVEEYLPVRRGLESREHHQARRLARAGGPEHREEFAPWRCPG